MVLKISFAMLDVVSSVLMGVWERLHRKLLLNSNAHVHMPVSLGQKKRI